MHLQLQQRLMVQAPNEAFTFSFDDAFINFILSKLTIYI